MPHPGPFLLQSYLDDELPDRARESVRLHIEQCPSCQERLQESKRLSLALRAALPAEQMFLSEGKFWSRLAGKLSADRPPTWPLVLYLPPLVLAVLGTVVQVLVFATLAAYGLIGLGLLPSPGPMVSERLSSLLSDQDPPQWLHARADWSLVAARTTINYWANLDSVTQDMLIFVTVLLALGVLLFVIVSFYSSWAMCWSGPVRPYRQKGVSDHGIRSHHQTRA